METTLVSMVAAQDFLLGMLEPFVAYSVTLFASNSVMGERSEEILFTTMEDGVLQITAVEPLYIGHFGTIPCRDLFCQILKMD